MQRYDPKLVAIRLAARRAVKGLDALQVAHATSIPVARLSAIEVGEAVGDAELMFDETVALCALYRITVDSLLVPWPSANVV